MSVDFERASRWDTNYAYNKCWIFMHLTSSLKACLTKGMHHNKIITTKSVEPNCFRRKPSLPPSGQVCGDCHTLHRDKVSAVIIPFAQTWADRDLRFGFVKKPLRLWPASHLKCIGFSFAVIDGAWSPPTGCWEISSAHDAEMGGGPAINATNSRTAAERKCHQEEEKKAAG